MAAVELPFCGQAEYRCGTRSSLHAYGTRGLLEQRHTQNKQLSAGCAGLQVLDARFGGECVVFEMSLQECLTQYNGASPFAQMMLALDGMYLIGTLMFELMPGKCISTTFVHKRM